MFNKIRNVFESMSKKSNVALYIVAGAMFIIAAIAAMFSVIVMSYIDELD